MGGLKIVAGYNDKRSKELEFEKLYLESYRRVYNYVYMRMGADSAVEDVVAEAYLLAARSFDKFDPSRAKFSTWVTKIAINCMRDHWRRERPIVSLENVPESTFSASDETEDVTNRMIVAQLMACLSAEEADLVLMKYMQGMRNVDIASELEMNASTVATKLSNAMRKMRAAAEEAGPEHDSDSASR